MKRWSMASSSSGVRERHLLVLFPLFVLSMAMGASAAQSPEDRPRVVAWLDRPRAKVGEQIDMFVEVIGPVSVDVYLGDPPPVPGLQFLPSSGPVSWLRVDSSGSGDVSRQYYVATFTIPIRVFSGGRYEITPPPVIAPDESEWTHGPLTLLADGPSSSSKGLEPSFEWVIQKTRVYAGERTRFGVRLEIDAVACPLEGRTFVLPWWDEVIALHRANGGGRSIKWAMVEGSDHRIALHQDGEVAGRNVFLGGFDVVAPDAGTISLGGSTFAAEPAGTFAVMEPDKAGSWVVASNDVEIEVLPLPTDGRPESFVDLVGEFDVRASVDRDEVQLGDSLTLTVEILERGGATNLPYARVVSAPDWPGFRSTGEPSYVTESGLCQIRFSFAPEDTAALATELDVSWFRPGTGGFATKRCGPFPIRIMERGGGSAAVDGAGIGRSEGLRWWMAFPVVLMWIVAWFAGVRRGRRGRAGDETTGEGPVGGETGAERPGDESDPRGGSIGPLVGERIGSDEAAALFDAEREESESRDSPEQKDDLGAPRALARYIGRRTGSPPAACFGPEVADRLAALEIDAALLERAIRFFDEAERRAFHEPDDVGVNEVATWGWKEAAELVSEFERPLGLEHPSDGPGAGAPDLGREAQR